MNVFGLRDEKCREDHHNLCSFLGYVAVQTLAKLSKRNQAMFNNEYKSFQKHVKQMTYWKL